MGHGQVKPVEAKVEAISDFPVPTCKRQMMRFLGMAGYYRKLCNNFSVIAEPLTNLLSKRMRFKWTSDCQNAFDKLKPILRSEPVQMRVMLVQVVHCCKRMTMVWIIHFVTFPKSLTNIKIIIPQ